jgi:hypothetical protein
MRSVLLIFSMRLFKLISIYFSNYICIFFFIFKRYLPFVLMHFIDLSLLMEGGHRDTIQDLTNKDIPINFCRPPWCCIGLCYKNITYNKYKHVVFFIKKK